MWANGINLFSIPQFVVGFFSFLILLCCEGATAGFRASLVPIHASFGLTTFMLAIAAAVTGLTEKVIFTLGYVLKTTRKQLRFVRCFVVM